MNEKQIDNAIIELLKDKVLKKSIGLTRTDTYDLKNRATTMRKLFVLWQAGKLQLKDGSTTKT